MRIAALDLRVDFAAGEEIHTEISAKFRRDRLERGAGRSRARGAPLVDRPAEGFGVALAMRL